MPTDYPAWDAVIVNFNTSMDVPACLAALRAARPAPATIIVVDNASVDDSLAALAGELGIQLIANAENLGFAGGANTGLAASTAPYVAIFNPDVQLDPGWPASLLNACMRDGRIGAAGGKLLYPDRKIIQTAGIGVVEPQMDVYSIGGDTPDVGQYDTECDIDSYASAALFLRRAALRAVGVFDERFYPAYYADIDLCYRLRQHGWIIRYVPDAVATHRVTITRDLSSLRHAVLYHLQRTQFVFKHLDRQRFVTEFLPAEEHALAEQRQNQKELEQYLPELHARVKQLEAELGAAGPYARQLERERASLQTYAAALEHALAQIRHDAGAMQRALADVGPYTRDLEAAIAAIEPYTGQLERELQKARPYIRALEAQIVGTEPYARDLEATLAGSRAYARALEAEAANAIPYIRELEDEFAKAVPYVRELEDEFAKAVPYVRRLEADMAIIVPYVRQLEERIAALEEENTRLIARLDSART